MIRWRDVIAWIVAAVAILCVVLLIAGCSPARLGAMGEVTRTPGTPPIVTARESATAALTIVSCPQTAQGGALVADLVTALAQQAPIVTAYEAGSARLVLNTCPSPPDPAAIRAAAEALRARR